MTELCDLPLEREALGSVLLRPELLQTTELAEGDFYSPSHARIWRELVYLGAEGEPINSLTLRARLLDVHQLAAVGGDDYLLGLTDTIPVAVPVERLRRLARLRALKSAAQRLAAACDSGEIEQAQSALQVVQDAALEEGARTKPMAALDALWQPIGTWIQEQPRARRWLLTRPNDETNGATTQGVLPVGKAGMLYAEGGTGKTFALIQLAVSIVTGRRWLDYFDVPHTGRVLLALAEEDREELHRRLFAVARAMRLTEQQERLAGERIVALPLAGMPVSVMDADGVSESSFLRWLRGRLKGEDYRLVVLDPLSRFAGADTEKDNAAATRFVQQVESMVTPDCTVLVSHHSRKPSQQGDAAAGASAHNARGASALGAGFRWAAELQTIGIGARFAVTKSNYSQHGRPIDLQRDTDTGYLTYSTQPIIPSRVEQSEGRYARDLEALVDLVRRNPGKSQTQLIAMAGVSKSRGLAMLDELEQRGVLRHVDGGRGAKEMHAADGRNGS